MNLLPGSIKSTGSKFSSFNMQCISYSTASQSASGSDFTWNDPTEEIMSSCRAATTTLPAMPRSTSHTPIGGCSQFLTCGINHHPGMSLDYLIKSFLSKFS